MDPVPGGNANAYTYSVNPIADPDTSGDCVALVACLANTDNYLQSTETAAQAQPTISAEQIMKTANQTLGNRQQIPASKAPATQMAGSSISSTSASPIRNSLASSSDTIASLTPSVHFIEGIAQNVVNSPTKLAGTLGCGTGYIGSALIEATQELAESGEEEAAGGTLIAGCLIGGSSAIENTIQQGLGDPVENTYRAMEVFIALHSGINGGP